MWKRLERCIQAPFLSHMGDNNATELLTVNSKMFNLVTERSRLETELATVSQKHGVLRERQRNHWDENPYVDIYRYYRIEKEISENIERNNEKYNLVRTALERTNWQMAQLSARLEEEISTLQIELSREIEKRQECINYAVKHNDAYKRSRANSEVCRKMDEMCDTFYKSEKEIAELEKIIDQKVKEYELLNSPLSTSVQLETRRQNIFPSGSVGYKYVPVVSKDAATYKCRELKWGQFQIPVAPIVSHGVVEEQLLQVSCFQARRTKSRKQQRTESESSKQLAVAEQISTCKMSQTNPRSKSEETSVQEKKKPRDLDIVSLTEELHELQQQSHSFDRQRKEYETQLVQTVATKQDRKLFKRKQKRLETLNEAIEELDEQMK